MAINDSFKVHSLDHIFNLSFDKKLQILGVELIGYDPLTDGLKRITTNAMGEYNTNDLEESGSISYVGKEDAGGDWIIQKIDTSAGTSIRYATVKNNPAVSSYSDAWAARSTTLTYDTYSVAF